jgi:hypothetical protein
MAKYFAIFPDGTKLTRKSDREYGAAWRVVFSGEAKGAPYQGEHNGFARTADLAVKAAGAEASRLKHYDWTIDAVEITETQTA